MSACYEGQQFVGIDLHRRRTVLVRMTPAGERLGAMVRFPSTPEALRREMAAALSPAGAAPQVVLEATYGWYWAAGTGRWRRCSSWVLWCIWRTRWGSRGSRIGG